MTVQKKRAHVEGEVTRRNGASQPESIRIIGDEIPPSLAEEMRQMSSAGQEWSDGVMRAIVEDSETETEEFQIGAEDSGADYRIEILGKAAHIVSAERNVAYGSPENSFAKVADLWNAYLSTDVLMPTDVAAMLALLKIARIASNPIHEDSYVDLAGYAACGADVARTLRQEAQQ